MLFHDWVGYNTAAGCAVSTHRCLDCEAARKCSASTDARSGLEALRVDILGAVGFDFVDQLEHRFA